MRFDGATLSAQCAGLGAGSVLVNLVLGGLWQGLVAAAVAGFVLYFLLHYYNQLEQRDLDDYRDGPL